MAALPQIGRASRVERPVAPGVDAAGDLYERYSAQILGYCLHQLGSREEAEDAVQTTFMNAFRGLQRGIVPELESAWLFKIAHNVCLSRRRSSWRRGKVEAPNNLEVLQEVIPGREQVSHELIRLQDVLEEMPESQRRAILLREWQGLTYREISAELGLTQAAVETLIFRARRALAQGLEQNADTWKRRLRRGADVGGVITFVKALLGGGGAAAVKVAVTAIAVATTAVTAATEMPRQVDHLAAANSRAPAAKTTKHARTLHTLSAASLTPASARPLAHPAATHATRTRPAERSLPKPVTLSTSDTATPPPAASAAAAAQEPTQPQPDLPAAIAASPTAAPSDNGNGKKDERTPQSTTQPTETTSAPPTTPPADPGPTQAAPEPAQDDGKPDQARGNGNSDLAPGHSDEHDNGKSGK